MDERNIELLSKILEKLDSKPDVEHGDENLEFLLKVEVIYLELYMRKMRD